MADGVAENRRWAESRIVEFLPARDEIHAREIPTPELWHTRPAQGASRQSGPGAEWLGSSGPLPHPPQPRLSPPDKVSVGKVLVLVLKSKVY